MATSKGSILDNFTDPDVPDPPEHLLPRPLLWLMLVRPFVFRKKINGIIIPDEAIDTQAFQNIKARILKMGPACYRNHITGEPWVPPVDVQEGDIITMAKFAGQKMTIKWMDGMDPREIYLYYINCEDVTGVVERPVKAT